MTSPGDSFITEAGTGQTPTGESGPTKTGLPLSLLRQSSKRLQAVSLTVVVLLATGWLANNLIQCELAYEFQFALEWIPPTVMLVASFTVFGLARGPWLSPARIITVGLVYEVIVSFCIPVSSYYGTFGGLHPQFITSDLVGVSPVALWILFFTVLVLSRPRHALIAFTLSGSAVPITVAHSPPPERP